MKQINIIIQFHKNPQDISKILPLTLKINIFTFSNISFEISAQLFAPKIFFQLCLRDT